MAPAGRAEHRQLEITQEWVNLLPESVEALELAVRLGGDTRRDAVNRALQVYAILLTETHDGGSIAIKRPDGSLEDVEIT
jgi:hypothetical protein